MQNRTNLSKPEEYQALRRFIKLSSCPDMGYSQRLARAMQTELTPKQFELMRLYYVEQRRIRDIASEKGVAPSTVSRTIARGRSRLRCALRYGGVSLLRALEDDV